MQKREIWIFWLYFLAVTAWILLYLLGNNRADWDLWGVMSFGALLDQNPGVFPYRDVFSFTAFGEPWIYHEWGSGVIFYQLFKHLGSPALFWLKVLLVMLIFLLACHRVVFRHAAIEKPAGASLAVFHLNLFAGAYLLLPIVSTTIRCQLFTFVLFALFLFMLERYRAGLCKQVIWSLPVLMLFWVNVHGGFITGLFALGVYVVAFLVERRYGEAKALGLILLLSGVTVFFNPYGFAFVQTMLSAWSLPREAISEWGNVFQLAIPGYGALYTILLAGWLLFALWYWKRSSRQFPYALLLLVGTGLYGWLHYKLAPLFLITLLSVGSGIHLHAKERLSSPSFWRALLFPVYAYLLPALLLIVGLVPLGMLVSQDRSPFQVKVSGAETVRADVPLSRNAYPIGAVTFLKSKGVKGNLWAPFSWGEYLYWALYPEFRISMDGRYETIYTPAVYEDYQRFYNSPYDLTTVAKYHATHILIPAYEQELLDKMHKDPQWHPVYRDTMSILFAQSVTDAPALAFPETTQTLDEYKGDLGRFGNYRKILLSN